MGVTEEKSVHLGDTLLCDFRRATASFGACSTGMLTMSAFSIHCDRKQDNRSIHMESHEAPPSSH